MLHTSTKLEPDHQMMHMFGLGWLGFALAWLNTYPADSFLTSLRDTMQQQWST
jgi:hypothetical protein